MWHDLWVQLQNSHHPLIGPSTPEDACSVILERHVEMIQHRKLPKATFCSGRRNLFCVHLLFFFTIMFTVNSVSHWHGTTL